MFKRERFLSCPSLDRWFLGEMMERGFWLNMDDVDIIGLYGLRLDAPVDGARDSRDKFGAPDDVSLSDQGRQPPNLARPILSTTRVVSLVLKSRQTGQPD